MATKCFWMVGLALLGLVLFLGTGCDGGTTNPPVDGDDGTNQDGDGGSCPTLCSVDSDCCPNQGCRDGVCVPVGGCPSGCNYECNKAAGEICDQGTKMCIQGSPPLNCQSDCNCYTGEVCDNGTCVPACTSDADCPTGMECRDSRCKPAACATREDCAGGAGCLVCKNQECVAEPAVCAGDNDCCVGRRCNFGTCVDDVVDQCQADSDCTEDPDLPRCVDGTCVQECVNDIDCDLGEVCLNTHCESSGCTPASCDTGYWCDTGDGTCKPGCDENADCTVGTCDYVNHTCGQTDCCGNACTPGSQYCDTFTCQCVTLCAPAPGCSFTNNCCPTNYNCDEATGKCMCTAAACPAGSTCNTTTGACEADQTLCDPPCVPPETCVNGTCMTSGTGGDGDPCFTDSECNAAAGFLCDGSIFCIGCMLADPNFVPEFVCREECSLLGGGCTNGAYSCEYRHTGLKGLCVP